MMRKPIRPKAIIRTRRKRLLRVTLALLLGCSAFFGYSHFINRGWVATDDAFVSGHLITVKAQTEGTIVEVLAENTQPVRQGQVLVRLDGVRAQLELQRAEAELGETVRHIKKLGASLNAWQQRIAARRAALAAVRHDLARYLDASKNGAASEQQVQNARDKILEIEASIKEAEAEKAGVEAEVGGIGLARHPAVENAKSRLRQAFLDYKRRLVIAPADGIVAKRRAHIGDLVKPGAPLLVIVPLDDVWIEANFLENQIADIRPGQTAEIKVDAYGSQRIYHGRVQGINPGTGSAFALLPTDNTTGNFIHIAERVPVRIGLDAKELRNNPLQPGLSTLTRVKIGDPNTMPEAAPIAAAGKAYRTGVYEHELDDAEAMIEKVVSMNRIDRP